MKRGSAASASTLDEATALLEAALAGTAREEIVDALLGHGPSEALARLRRALRSHSFRTRSGTLDFERLTRKLDNRTRADGFRVLHSWNHRLHAFSDDVTPVLMLDYFVRAEVDEPDVRTVIAILIDYYFLHVLALCAMRCWDAADPDAALDRVTVLLETLQGPGGSGHRFLDDAETAIIYALSQFHPEEQAYDRFIDRFRALDVHRQTRFAMASASVLSCHLRWGFWLMYGRDVLRMRADNVGDYPWLLYSVATLMRAFVRGDDADPATGRPARDDVVDALLQGLAADPWAFTGKGPPALKEHRDEHAELRRLLVEHGSDLVDELEAHRPSKEAYSPLGLHFNFPHNTLVALVAMALIEGRPQTIPLNGLFVRDPGAAKGTADLARAVMAYSGASPDRLGAHGARLVAYDALSGLRSFTMTVDALRELIPADLAPRPTSADGDAPGDPDSAPA
jgi:hypothetical protein